MSASDEAMGIEHIGLPRVRTRCVALDPLVWGFESRDEMETAFRIESERWGGRFSAEAAAGGDYAAAPDL